MNALDSGSGNTLIIRGDELNSVLEKIYYYVMQHGKDTSPRGQPVKEWHAPVVIELTEHKTPWTFIEGRRLNPYFAIAEVIWILAGRKDVAFISYYNKNIANFSSDGKEFDGAYGDRIRNYPEYTECDGIGDHGDFFKDHIDQIELVVRRLKHDSFSRQAVIALWDPSRDLKDGSKDYPCNNLVYTSVREGSLKMSVVRRSNDMLWGLPYNQVQFYFVQALIAGSLDLKMGEYYEYVQNMHVYKENYKHLYELVDQKIKSQKLCTDCRFSSPDRRINIDQLKKFCDMFFAAEALFRLQPSGLTKDAVHSLMSKMYAAGIPEYWCTTMLMVPLAYIARKNNMQDVHDDLIVGTEASVRWLVEDFQKGAM